MTKTYETSLGTEIEENVLDYDTMKLLRDEVLGELDRRGIYQDDAIASVKRVVQQIEEGY